MGNAIEQQRPSPPCNALATERTDAERPADAPTTAGEESCPAKQHREPFGAAQATAQSGSLRAIDATARSKSLT